MPQSDCQLTLIGENALKTLLKGLKWPTRNVGKLEIWKRGNGKDLELQVKEVPVNLGLHRNTVGKMFRVVDPVPDPARTIELIDRETLIIVFQKLYDGLPSPLSKSSFCKQYGCWGKDRSWEGCTFWEEIKHLPNPNDKHLKKLLKLLTTLDYISQFNTFTSKIDDNYEPLACIIDAPCSITQRWAINRLLQTNHLDGARKVISIDIEKRSAQFDDKNIDLLWQLTAENLRSGDRKIDRGLALTNIDPLKIQSQVINNLFNPTKNRGAIIVLYNFEHSDLTPQDIIDRFWIPIINQRPSESARSRIVLLIAANQLPILEESDRIINLLPLKCISKTNVEDWWESTEVKQWYCKYFKDCKRLEKDESIARGEWKWENPRKILNRICIEFGLEHGAQSLHDKWEW